VAEVVAGVEVPGEAVLAFAVVATVAVAEVPAAVVAAGGHGGKTLYPLCAVSLK